MKRKINLIAIGNFIGLISGLSIMFEYFYKICILPFFKKELVGITPFGFIILFLAFIVVIKNFAYFEERIKK